MEERFVDEHALMKLEAELVAEERSKGTRENYLRAARTLMRWLEGGAVLEGSVAAWRDSLLADGYAPATVNAMVAGANKLMHANGWDSYRARLLRLQRRLFRDESRELTRPEYVRLVATARSLGRERAALTIETICSTGIRVSELRFLTVEAVRRGRAVVSLKGKVRTVLVPHELVVRLMGYAARRGVTAGPILVTRTGRPLSRGQIWAEMKSVAAAAGIDARKVFPHNLRHLFARAFHEVCHDIVRLADVLGHSSINTTRIYLMSTGAEHERVLERLGLVV